MTSSLVGSEMCIRDSCIALCMQEDYKVLESHQARPRSILHRDRDTLCPVSYTHLTLPTICSV
eukprot:11365806-Prorocentrum_lima.AAC.1